MPLKLGASRQIDYLSSYIPYSLGEEFLIEDIDEMLTYNILEPVAPQLVSYDFGATRQLLKTLLLKNTTSNANIEVELEYDVRTLTYQAPDVGSGELGLRFPENKFVMVPEQIVSIQIFINERDIKVGGPFNTNFIIRAKNLSNGSLVTRRPDITLLEPRQESFDITISS